MAATIFLRTSIILGSRTTDLQIPAESPVEDITFELIRDLHRIYSEVGLDTEVLADTDAVWTLELFGRRQLDPEQSLAEQGVLDGTRLWLTKNAKNETYPAIIDDLAEAVSKYQEKFPKWNYEIDAVRYASVMLGLLPIGVLLALDFMVGWGLGGNVEHRWWYVAAAVFAAVLSSVLATVLSRSDQPSPLRVALLMTGYTAVASAAFMAIPRSPCLWHLPVVTGCLLLYAVVILPLTRSPIILHTSVITASIAVLTVTSINFLHTSPPSVIAVQTVTLAYMMVLLSSKPALKAGRVETPYVSAVGESLAQGETAITDINRSSSSGAVIESVVNQQKQNHAAHEHLLGILLGGLTVMVLGVVFAALYLRDRDLTVFFVDINDKWLLALYVCSVTYATMSRARNYIDRDVHTLVLTGSIVMVLAYLGTLVAVDAPANMTQIVAVSGIFSLATVIGSLWALGQKRIRSPLTRWTFEMFEYFVYSLPVMWLAWMMDVYMAVRNR